ncbi:uncharacterized protein LOC123501521, partial [Portunus trituberculatus]|uniref:uncharacterized protein LOC123501521 n=1 Tax=Portunus trituberculatus TaxID=210409 RepID=UPI001E1CE0B9
PAQPHRQPPAPPHRQPPAQPHRQPPAPPHRQPPAQPWLVALVVVLACLPNTPQVTGHVALTFPPARSYDLDFLDSFRTQGPCGMPKGDIKTTLLQGATFNVSWHLAYPHRGGFRLELLDPRERRLADLTPTTATSKFLTGDATAQEYRVTLPAELECRDCSIRLIRQAVEWGKKYMFWSCSDVDIVPRSEYRERCSGNGRLMVSKCRCNKGYYGERCQFANECEDNSQCGVFGRCVDVSATAYPKKLCYCRAGRFGPKCGSTSLVTNKKQVNLRALNKKVLSSDLTLYWRVLTIEKELEVVLVNNGTSYAALGWRPAGIGKECKGFPYIPDESLASSAWRPKDDDALVPEGNPEPESEPEPEGEPKTEPEPEGEPESEPEPHSKPEPEPEGEPEPESEPKSEPEPESEPKSEPEPESEPKSEPEPESEPISEPEAESEPKSEPEPESEPKGEPEPESEPKGEPEPEPEPEGGEGPQGGLLVPSRGKREAVVSRRQRRFAVPLLKETADTVKAEPEPESEPKSEPESEPKSEPESEPEAEPETASKSQAIAGKTAFTPKGDFHAMDCADVVMGVAVGNHYRIQDFYTRDRSTPRPDEFWGGANSLTAALGWEEDGQTILLFRRKLEATEPTDHAITKGLMHVIWARGQEVGNYVHSPKSGLEAGQASVQDFYRAGEFKYHGKAGQRGVVAMDFLESEKEADSQAKEEVDWCGDHWRYPSSCRPGVDCEYYAKWEYDEGSDYITFLVQTSEQERWTGIGFTDNRRMSLTDAVLGWVEQSGRYFMYDAWARGYSSPVVDPNQGIKNFSANIEDGITTLKFERKRVSGDREYDLSFTDEGCLYMVFPIKGGLVNFVSKKIRKHTLTPIMSPERVCIRSCSKFGGADGKPFVYTTTPRPPRLHYEVEVKLTDVGDDFVVPERGSTSWQQLTNRVRDTVEGALTPVPGYLATEVTSVEPDGAGNLLTKMEVMIDEKEHLKEVGTLPALESGKGSVVREVLQKTIAGAMGNLRVDPQYLRVSELRAETSSDGNTVTSLSGEEENAALSFLSVNKNWVIVGIVAALVVLTVVQAAVTVSRNKKSGTPPVSTKQERLITNSGWRDYSGNQNYIYDTTEMRENGVNARRQVNTTQHQHHQHHQSTRPVTSTTSRPQAPPNGHHHHHNNHQSQHQIDSRSLQRPRGAPPQRAEQRSTYSLPRGQGHTQGHSQGHSQGHTQGQGHSKSPGQDVTPDFYYLPSQRKYTGEVVHVYVDYNE